MRVVAERSSVGMAAVAAALLVAASPAPAADFYGENWSYESPDKTIELRGGFGAIGIEAREYVYNLSGSEDVLSLLIWQSVAPMATIDIKANLPDEWTIKARARAAIAGDSYMEDYDWFGPDFVSFAADDWTHRSQHPNTNLDWYLDGSIAIGKNIIVDPAATLNLHGGFRYTDVQWAAIGGSFVYSDSTVDNPGNNFHAYSGDFGDVPSISYRQQLPVLFAGLDAEVTDGQWTFSADAQAGVVLFGLATDHHWMRDLRFLDIIQPAPIFAASATATYDFSDNLGAFLSGSVEKLMVARADTETYDIPTGTKIGGTAPNVAGAELGTISISAGLKGSF